VDPSPHDQNTDVGVAVAVTLTPGTDAVAARGPHDVFDIQPHTGTPTRFCASAAGFVETTGDGRTSRADAIRATCSGDATGTAAPAGTHTGPDNASAPEPVAPVHVRWNQPPAPAG
jgi:hypothetical protein